MAVVILLGAPHCGKTTQAGRLFASFGLQQILFDDILREAKQGNLDSAKAEQNITDHLLIDTLVAKVFGEVYRNGFTLEGYPWTYDQARQLDEVLAKKSLYPSLAIFIDTGDQKFAAESSDLLLYFTERGKLYRINGKQTEEEVESDIIKAINHSAQGLIKEPTLFGSAVPGDHDELAGKFIHRF